MAASKKKQAKADAKKPSKIEQIEKNQRKQEKMMKGMWEREKVMKWLLIAAIILILLLILFFGFATDWLKGLNKDATVTGTTPISSSLDSASTPAGTTGTSGTSGTSTTGTTTTGKDSTSSTTNNTTTNNTTTTTPPTTTVPTDDGGTTTVGIPLLNLYASVSPGGDISATLNNAQLLGISKTCHTSILIQVCDFTDGNGNIVTTNNLLGTGLITSLTKNF